jgi:hypothetical protein
MIRKLWFFFHPLLVISCVSVSTLKIQVLEPASDPLVPDIENVVILNRTIIPEPEGLNDTSLQVITDLYNRSATEMVFALADILNESPGIRFIDQSMIREVNTSDLHAIPLKFDADFIRLLCDSLNATALISVETYFLEFGFTQIHFSGFPLDIEVSIAALWRIYEMPEGNMTREYVWLDTLTWESDAFTELPSYTDILMEAAYFSALTLARKISPYWLEHERKYFSRGDKILKKAAKLIRNNNFDEAKILYESLLEHRNKNVIAAASFNLSLIYEIEGDFPMAHDLAVRSSGYRQHPSISAYIAILEERIQKSKELDRQLDATFP